MPNPIHEKYIIILAGLFGGFVLGIFLNTKTELEKRGLWSNKKIQPFAILNWKKTINFCVRQILAIIFVGLVHLLTVLSIFRIGGIDSLKPDEKNPFVLALMAGVMIGKFVRYLYWKRK